jgi:hypothetical protein
MALIAGIGSVYENLRRVLVGVGIAVKTTANQAVTLAATISAGSAAASSEEPNGSFYLRSAGPLAHRVGTTWAPVLEAQVLVDPGNAGAIPVTNSGIVSLVSAGAETRTLAIPAFKGQRLVLVCDTYVGDIVVATSAPCNVANNNRLTFGVVSEAIELIGVSVGGALVWQIGWNDGVGLTTV